MVTFSRPVVIDTYTGDTEIEMLCDGEFVGSIRSESDEDGVHAYEVVFGYSDDDSKDKYFQKFTSNGKEFTRHKHKFLEKVDQYYKLKK